MTLPVRLQCHRRPTKTRRVSFFARARATGHVGEQLAVPTSRTEPCDAELMLSAFGSSRFRSPVFAPVQGELHSHRDVTERLLTKAIAIRRSWTCDRPLDSSLRLRRVSAWPPEPYAWH